jgi:hypothetical protein
MIAILIPPYRNLDTVNVLIKAGYKHIIYVLSANDVAIPKHEDIIHFVRVDESLGSAHLISIALQWLSESAIAYTSRNNILIIRGTLIVTIEDINRFTVANESHIVGVTESSHNTVYFDQREVLTEMTHECDGNGVLSEYGEAGIYKFPIIPLRKFLEDQQPDLFGRTEPWDFIDVVNQWNKEQRMVVKLI